jgi:outer membrane immunogenic protein
LGGAWERNVTYRKAILALLAGVGLVISATSSSADGGPRHSIQDDGAAPAISWTGFYLGVSAGAAHERAAWTVPGIVTTPTSGDGGTIFGATVGFNFQRASWVFGIEGDWSRTDADVFPIQACGGGCGTGVDWLATLRGRAGILVSPTTLLFVTGGIAWADIESRVVGVSQSETVTGWVAGAGFEVKLDSRWSVKGEYLRVELDDSLACSATTCGVVNNATNNRMDVLRAGLNFKF